MASRNPYHRPFMRRLLRRARWSSLVTAASLLSGCMLTINNQPVLPSFDATAIPVVAGWEVLAPGLERRIYLPRPENGLLQFVTLRIDPAYFTFRAHYSPAAPMSLQRWRDTLPGPVAFINANYFDIQGNAMGLLVSDGVPYTSAYTDRGGIFQVQDGQVRIRSSIYEPYYGEALEQAVQAFPMLVLDGQPAYTNAYDTDSSRRTVIGQDTNGRVVLMVTALSGMTLPELSAWLPTTDLNLWTAFNLDGGGSTMMYIGAGGSPQQYRSFDSVPAVLAVYAR